MKTLEFVNSNSKIFSFISNSKIKRNKIILAQPMKIKPSRNQANLDID